MTAKGKKRGLKPNHLQLDEKNWENALKKAIRKKNRKRTGLKRTKNLKNLSENWFFDIDKLTGELCVKYILPKTFCQEGGFLSSSIFGRSFNEFRPKISRNFFVVP